MTGALAVLCSSARSPATRYTTERTHKEVFMRYPVLLQRRGDGKYHASVPLLPEITRVGDTRDETLQAIEHAITEVLQTTEVVYLDVPEVQAGAPSNPWLDTAGVFADDPELESMLRDIYATRD